MLARASSEAPTHHQISADSIALHIYHHASFEIKSQIVEYARSLAGSMRVIDVQPGYFTSNFWTHFTPRKAPDGGRGYILPLPFAADTRLPLLDVEADFGRFVLAALQSGVETVRAAADYISAAELAKAFTDCKSPSMRLSKSLAGRRD